MSTIADGQDLMVSPFAFFLEEGTTVDGVVIGPADKPDITPLTNWSDGSLGALLELKFVPKIQEVARMTPTASGVWEEETIRRLMQMAVALKTRSMGEFVRRLEHAVAAKIVQGTAQEPGAKSDPAIFGWLKVQMIRESTGTLEIFDWYAKMTLDAANTFNEQTPTPTLKFVKMSSRNGVTVVGNSVDWPEAV